MKTIAGEEGTVYLIHPPLLEAFWSERGNGAALSLEKHAGFSFISLAAEKRELCAEAFALLQKQFGSKTIRRGRLTPARLLFNLLQAKGKMFSCAESCTGGLIAAGLTDLPGSSKVFWGGLVVYANEAKAALLGVEKRMILEKGAVSEEVARALAENTLAKSRTDVSLAVTGIAGPAGGTVEKPVGTVWLAAAITNGVTRAKQCLFQGARDEIRGKAVAAGILLVESVLFGEENLDSF